MANTLKFGNGQWATKVGSTLAFNDENGNFKPLPFNFTRSTSGTRVNKDGLIEVVTNNKPRIDFLNDSNGALLLEPQRMNLVQYSEDFSNAYWSKTRIQTPYIADVVSPTGELNAYTLEISSGEVNGGGIFRAISVSGTNSISIFAKKKNTKYLIIGDENFNNDGVWFDLENGLVATEYGLANGSIENYGNGWYKCIMTYTKTSSLSKFIYFSNIDGTSNNGVVGGDSVYIWGAQVEQGSYATSYIPTQGSTATRVAEVCIQTPPSGIIGQTEGTMYFDGYFGDEVTEIYLFTQSSTGIGVSDSMYLQKSGASSVKFIGRDASTQWDIIGGSFSIGQKIKIAAAYKNNDVVLYINGLQIGTDSVASIPTISNIKIGGYPAQPSVSSYFLSKPIESTQLYNTRLSNAELQALTTI
jgi:hypothetical protein